MGALPEQRVSVITVGVRDLPGMIRFYTEVLGFEDRGVKGEVAFFNAGGLVIGLWEEAKLAADAGAPMTGKAASRALPWRLMRAPGMKWTKFSSGWSAQAHKSQSRHTRHIGAGIRATSQILRAMRGKWPTIRSGQ